VGELRDPETVATAITAAETGHLIFGTLHTQSAARTVMRILDQYPAQKRAHIRTLLASVLRGVVSQVLLPNLDGKGRSLACEVMVANSAIANLIREDRAWQIPMVMQTGKKQGTDDPAGDQQTTAAEPVGETAGDEVRDRLRDPEADDERQHRAAGRDAELALRDEREHRTLQPDHPADEGVDQDEQGELSPVRGQTEDDAVGRGWRHRGLERSHSAPTSGAAPRPP
jgi:hypothetical protein